MEIIYLDSSFTFKEDTVLCLGYFDGLHLGHIELIKKAKTLGKKVAILTYDISPKQFLKKLDRKVILDDEQRNKILSDLQVDYLLIEHFDLEYSMIDCVDFIKKIKALNVSTLVIGYDYRFGKDAKGNVETLLDYFTVIEVPCIGDENGKYSTSRVFNSLEQNDLNDVNKVLGRYYSIKGKVVKGLQNGQKIGFRTANLSLTDNYYLPNGGVYACYAYVDNKQYLAMVNIGYHPSIDKLDERIVEAHLIDFNEDIYGKEITLDFVYFIRGEIHFLTLDQLKIQLDKDKNIVKRLLSNGKIKAKY